MKEQIIPQYKLERLKKQFTSYANRMLKEAQVTVEVNMVPHGSLTYFKPNSKTQAVIQIGYADAYNLNCSLNDRENSDGAVRVRMEGFLNHEIAHLLYTQFERMGYCREKESKVALEIATYASKEKEKLINETATVSMYSDYDEQFWLDIVPDVKVYEHLKDLFFDRVYWHNMADMLNMVEDAAIECRIPAKAGLGQYAKDRIYGSIAAARNHIYSQEKDSIRQEKDPLKACMFEFHEFGVIGYRMHTDRTHLNKTFSKKDVSILFDLAMYSKWNTQNTEERYVAGRCALDMMKPLIEEKAMEHLSSYLKCLYSAGSEEELPSMDGYSAEVSISMPNQTASGSCNQSSEYQYDIPDDTKKQLEQEKQTTDEELKEQNSNEESSNGPSDSGSESQSDDAQSSGSEQDSQKMEENSSSKSGDGNPELSFSVGDSNQKENSGATDSGNDNNSDVSCDSDSSDSNETGENSKNVLSKRDFEKMAEEAKNLSKTLIDEEDKKSEQARDNDLKESVKASVSDLRKQVNKNQPVNCDIDFHKGIHTNIHAKFGNYKDENAYSKKRDDARMAIKVSSEINLLKMYDKRARTKISKSGKLNNSSLYRAMTDQKCFKKVSPGKKKNFRIALLMDLSGSMYGSKMTNAIRTAYVLANSCIKSNVPVSVWGHNFSYHCELYKFLDYNQKTVKHLENVYAARANGCNQDGLAIFQVAHDLVAHRHGDEELILIVLSDGQPAGANNYYGIPAEEDIKKITNSFKKLFGMHTIGITIETTPEEVESCRRIYGDNCVVVQDSSLLALETVKLLKKLICN